MISLYTGSKYIEKVLTSAAGEQFRVTFLVSLIDGQMKAKVVSVAPLSTEFAGSHKSKTILLPTFAEKVKSYFRYTPSPAPKISYFDSLFFFTSQLTRAPSF
jgi:hypothetical protein